MKIVPVKLSITIKFGLIREKHKSKKNQDLLVSFVKPIGKSQYASQYDFASNLELKLCSMHDI